jgi:hypothetical protein
MLKIVALVTAPIAIALIALGIGWMLGLGDQIAPATEHDKLGWMDDQALTAADMQRIAEITWAPYGSNRESIKAIQSGRPGNLTRRDFELLRQDRRRARAAHPDVDGESLFLNGWFNVDLSAKVPMDWCSSYNSNGTKGSDGAWYLDGGCYMSFVNPYYPERASAEATKQFYEKKKKADDAKRLQAIKDHGIHWGAGSSSGWTESVSCNQVTGLCKCEWGGLRDVKRFTFPFVPEEWVGVWAGGIEKIKQMPSFQQAIVEPVENPAITFGKPAITSTGRAFDGTLLPGESVGVELQLNQGK